MLNEKQKTGLWGEVLAVRYLRDRGYLILNTNFRVGRAEIDIIAQKDGVLSIVEVKTRAPGALLPPAENVDWEKQENLRFAASVAHRLYGENAPLRFDIAEVLFESPTKYTVNFIPNAF